MSTTSGQVTWFEVASTDLARSADFYAGLCWTFHGDPSIYLSVAPMEGTPGIPGGLMPAPPGVGPYALFGVEVDDVDTAHAHAVELGAVSVVEPADNPGDVRSAYLRDPDGSLFSIYRFTSR